MVDQAQTLTADAADIPGDDQAKNDQPHAGGLLKVAKVVIGNGSYVGLGFIANLVSANGLSPAEFGLVAVALATLNVLQEVAGNGLDLSMVRLAAPHAEERPERAAAFYRAALQLKFLVNGVVALLLYLAAPYLAEHVFKNVEIAPLLNWVCVGLLGACLYNYTLARVQAEERFTLYAILRASNNIGKLAILGAIALFDFFRPDAVLSAWILAFFLGYVLSVAAGGTRQVAEPEGERFDPVYWKQIIGFSKWVVASSFLFSLYSRVDMLVLARYVDTAEIGQYAAAWNITYIIDLMTYSVIIALLPQAVKIQHHGHFPQYLARTFGICLLLALCLSPLFFLSGWLFSVFFPEYTQSADLFRVLFFGALVTLMVDPLYLILYARNRVNRLALINLCLLLFALAISLAVIPHYGAVGAAWVTVAGRIFASLLICFFVKLELQAISDD